MSAGLNGSDLGLPPRNRFVRETRPQDDGEHEQDFDIIRAARGTTPPPAPRGPDPMLIAFVSGVLAVLVTIFVLAVMLGGFG